MIKEARYTQVAESGLIRCRLCPHHCLMAEGQTGLCRVRRHQDGRIISLNHSRVAALAVDPVEKKPLYHFLPGSLTLSFAAPGCNLRCAFCQNHSLSQVGPGSLENTREMAPQEIVDMAVRQKLPSISFTYSEPTVFYEMMRETAELAHLAGIRTILVSNGYINPEPLQELTPFLDAANIDLKAFSERFYQTLCGGHLQPVLDSLGIIKKAGVWLEVTTLLIPGENDNPTELDELIRFLVNLDADIPWHVSRFHPQYRFSGRESTPAGAILGALERGRELGLHHLYAGNLETNPWQDTPCRNCGALLISRQGHQTRIDQLGQDGTCRRCRSPLAGRFNFSP